MHLLIGLIVGLIVGAILATVYHTRIAPVQAKLNKALSVAHADLAYAKTEALSAKTELDRLRQRIISKAQGLEKKL